MSKITIITNRKPRHLVTLAELPAKAQLDFDYIREAGEGHSARLVQYKGEWYDVFDTQAIRRWGKAELTGDIRVNDDDPLAAWDSLHGESYFSGVLFKLTEDDQVIVGRYFQ